MKNGELLEQICYANLINSGHWPHPNRFCVSESVPSFSIVHSQFSIDEPFCDKEMKKTGAVTKSYVLESDETTTGKIDRSSTTGKTAKSPERSVDG